MAAALAIITLLAVSGAAAAVAGIYMLAGLPWALISTGVALFGAAVFLRAGMMRNV